MRYTAARLLATGFTLLVITACGTEQSDPTPKPTGPVTTTISAAGETFELVTDELAVIEFVVPADAVLAPVEVTVTPLPPGADGLVRFSVGPAPTPLRLPAKITVRLPDGVTAPSGTSFAYQLDATAVALPTEVSAAGSVLTLETTTLGYGSLVDGAATAQQGDGGWYDMRQIECLVSIESLQIRLERARNYPFSSAESALLLIQQIDSTQRLCDDDASAEDVFEAQVETAKQIACDRYVDASADAAVILSEDAKTLHDLSKQLLGWEGVKQSLDTNCGGLGGELMGNLATEFQEFVEAYETKLESTGLANGYDTLKDELNTVHDIYADSVLLSLKEAEAGIEERVLARLFTLWREKAYASCRTEGTQAYLIDIHDFGQVIGKKLKPVGWRHLPQWAPYSEAEIARDLNLCATDVTLDVYTAKPRLRDDLRSQLGGGDAPGAHVQEASTASGVTSTLTLSGEVLAINCAAADEAPKYATDELVVELNNVEITRLQPDNGRFLSTPEEIDVAQAFDKIGRDPSLVNTYALTVTRSSPYCPGVVGLEDAELFSVDVEFDPEPILSGLSASSSTLTADKTKEVVFTLAYEDQGINLSRLFGTVVLEENNIPFDNAVSGSEGISGFDALQGSGTFKTTMTVFCSEKDSNPVILTMQLLDDFDQESEERSANLVVDYSECE